MNGKELWAIINVGDVLKNTEVEKVLSSYDFKKWEIEELLALENNTNLTLNEFRWKYVKETLEITDSSLNEEGLMVRDLIEDIKMGYHGNIEGNIDTDDVTTMNFDYELYRDFETSKISTIHIFYYVDCNINDTQKVSEINELLSFLNLNKDKLTFLNRQINGNLCN